jgi:hypothetical protein
MKIYTRLVFDIETGNMIEADSYEYDGPVDLCCGASDQQNDTYNQQSELSKQVMQQGQTVFGNASSVFNDLVSSLAPTIAAGPNQEGFSAAEKSALQSQAITNAGTSYRNAKAAVGNAMASQGGGNTGLTSGTNIGIEADLATSAAENTANQLNTVNLQDYATGRQNYDTAVGDLENATNVFNPATNLDNAATGALEGQASTANQIAQQDNSWVQSVTGALGGIAGGIATGGMSNLGKGVGFFGSGSK